LEGKNRVIDAKTAKKHHLLKTGWIIINIWLITNIAIYVGIAKEE